MLIQRWDKVSIIKNECNYYDSIWLDLSQFEYFYSGNDCLHYDTGELQTSVDMWKNNGNQWLITV